MTITRFKFTDNFRGWSLSEASFEPFNLFVGISGVGKTRILNALQWVRSAGISSSRRVNGCEWMLEIEADGKKYVWEAEASLINKNFLISSREDEDDEETTEFPQFLRERIIRDGQEILINRVNEEFQFEGKALPKLKNTESAITLLKDEPTIAPLNRALRRIIFSEAPDVYGFMPYDSSHYNGIRKRYRNLESLREATDVPILVKAFILQEDYPEEFQEIKDDYAEIFETACDVKLGKLSELDPSGTQDAPPFAMDWLALAVKERDVDGWITGFRLSSGMYRTLVHLIELAMAPAGTVVVIDEFENSLGVNCLPALTDRLLRRSREMQFIITSHHPYIINNIPSNKWRLVTRKGSIVKVLDEQSIPALQTASSHDKFIRLLNLKEYEEGIQ